MSTTSYTPVMFVGGPKGGTSAEFAGEPKSPWTPKRGDGGHYTFEWDRDDDGVKVRSGVYTWQAGEGAPQDGDGASALLAEVGPDEARDKLNASGSTTVQAPTPVEPEDDAAIPDKSKAKADGQSGTSRKTVGK